MKKKVFFLVVFCFSVLLVFSQRNISGTVKIYDTGEPVKGVKVSIKGTEISSETNEKGVYKLSVPDSIKTIEFSEFKNMFIKEVQFLDNGKIDILLSEAVIDIFELTLEELVNLEVKVASNVVTELKKQPVSITSISQQQLTLSGARTLLEALMVYVPGFFIIEDQDDLIAGFRGLAPDNNLKVMLLIDGNVMNCEWFFGAASSILNTTNLEFIEKVEVIRGPGSVTLGQGALLGVINIITKSGTTLKGSTQKMSAIVGGTAGMDNFYGGNANVLFYNGKVDGFVNIAGNFYEGQKLRSEGWANDRSNDGYLAGNVASIGTKLKANDNLNIVGNFGTKKLRFNYLVFNQSKDLYNFYRDRNQIHQTLGAISASYKTELTEKISFTISGNGALDDYALTSVDGNSSVDNIVMGGTRENRFGAKALLNVNEQIKNNKLAIGVEFKRFAFGKENFAGNNFINNIITDEVLNDYDNYLNNANKDKVWGYEGDLNVFSVFAEDFHTIADVIDIFGAIRFDIHPYWGSNFSPRVGLLFYPIDKLIIRTSYQTGFRGAAGVHYGGGYRLDGFLSADNYTQVEEAQIPIYDDNNNIIGYETNIASVAPELMKSFELAVDYDFIDNFNFYAVGFYNIVQNVIDVGVYWRDATVFTIPSLGTDVPGDWNGYWFYKNTEGQIVEGGTEINLGYKSKSIIANLNHSYVTVLEADEQQLTSMYLTSDQNFKAFPENVTRLNVVTNIKPWLSLGFNYLYYYKWYSPRDFESSANHLVNFSTQFRFLNNFNAIVSVTNLLNQSELYPMNSNAGDTALSDGTPAVEKTSVWLSLKYNF